MSADLILLGTREISVLHRHGTIATLWGFRLIASTLVALVFAFQVRATGVGSLPGGDQVLFAPGALHLLEVLRLGGSYLIGALKTGLSILCVLSVFELVPLAALLVALAHRVPARIVSLWSRAVQHFPGFFMLSAITLLTQAAWLLAMSIIWAALQPSLVHSGERLPTFVGALIVCIALFGAACLGSVLDVCRAAAVRQCLGGKDALIAGLETLRARPLAVLFGWIPAGFAALSLVIGAALITHRINVAHGGLGRVAGVFVVHQLAALGICYARAAWLTNALRLTKAQ